MLIQLPPYPARDGSPVYPPECMKDWPIASINYRWGDGFGHTTDPCGIRPQTSQRWPVPIHDAAMGLSWILTKLAPPKQSRRDIYVYGSHLGASLATSLSLTEAHSHLRFGIRGFLAYNGVYNWTRFLPDHRDNGYRKASDIAQASRNPRDLHINRLKKKLPVLFDLPTNLFDPFASPSLLFHNPGILVPLSFSVAKREQSTSKTIVKHDSIIKQPAERPRRSHLVFPPRASTLKIPYTLLLYDSFQMPLVSTEEQTMKNTRSGDGGNTFEHQALELARLMKRSILTHERKERMKWDNDNEGWARDSQARIQAVDLGQGTASLEIPEAGTNIVHSWLRQRRQVQTT